MKRRQFLQTTAAGTGAVFIKTGPAKESNKLSSRHFELEEITVAQLQADMASGSRTSKSICQLYLDRIRFIDQAGPAINSVIELNPDALDIADKLDQERRENGPRGPLHGIPIMIKDNIDTADKMQTTAGSLALAGSIAKQDSFVAQRLREAGAVILGKTNLSEWANFRSTNSTSGWSGRGGLTRNPYVLDRSACGSSSGSGAAASANLCAITIGTETNGSIICPASTNGLVGIKPTVGLVSRSGIIPIAHTQDTAGPMARTVTDAALLLGALTGVDSRDSATSESDGNAHTDYTRFLQKNGLRGARIGVARNLFGFHDGVDAALEEALNAIKDAGATLIDTEIPRHEGAGSAGYDVLLYEFKADLNKYLAGLGPDARVKSLEDVIAFNERHADQEMPFFGQEIHIAAQEKGPLTDQEYIDALEKTKRFAGEEGIDAVMEKDNLDCIVAPSNGPAWTIDLVNGDSFGGGSSSPAARSGYANITVPAGFVHGLPVGLSFFAGPWSEPDLLKYAYAFEQATMVRKAPTFLPSLK